MYTGCQSTAVRCDEQDARVRCWIKDFCGPGSAEVSRLDLGVDNKFFEIYPSTSEDPYKPVFYYQNLTTIATVMIAN